MLGVFNVIRTIAAAEKGHAHADFEPVDLAVLAAEVAELYTPLAEEHGLTMGVSAPAASARTGWYRRKGGCSSIESGGFIFVPKP